MKRFLSALLLSLVLTISVPVAVCYANSPPPPRIVIIVPDAPSDLTLYVGETKGSRDDRLTAAYFTIYPYHEKLTEFILTASTGNDTFELPIKGVTFTFNNVYTLDLGSRQLTSGPPATRFLWLPITIILTLALEGLVFFLFRYRARRSWLIFAVVNIFTQIGLYAWLSQDPSFNDMYILLDLVIGEVLVFIVEIIAFVLLLKEHGRLRAASYAIVSNIFSLFAGGYLLTVLPPSF